MEGDDSGDSLLTYFWPVGSAEQSESGVSRRQKPRSCGTAWGEGLRGRQSPREARELSGVLTGLLQGRGDAAEGPRAGPRLLKALSRAEGAAAEALDIPRE